jgi:hypothetical protein
MLLTVDDDVQSNRSNMVAVECGLQSVYIPNKRVGTHINVAVSLGSQVPIGISGRFIGEPCTAINDIASVLSSFLNVLTNKGLTNPVTQMVRKGSFTLFLDRGYM